MYCTEQSLIVRFGEQELIQLSDRYNTGVIDSGVVALAISDATAKINGYLALYPLPLAVIPDGFERMACDIARYYLYDDAVPDQVRRRYDEAVTYLAAVASGAVELAFGAGGSGLEQGSGVEFVKDVTNTFGDLSRF